MNSYHELFKIIYKRIRALLGREAVIAIFKDLDLIVAKSGKISLVDSDQLTYEKFDNLVTVLNRKIGPVALLSFRIPVKRKARRKKLKLPALLES